MCVCVTVLFRDILNQCFELQNVGLGWTVLALCNVKWMTAANAIVIKQKQCPFSINWAAHSVKN